MQFVFSVRDALQTPTVITKQRRRANSGCAVGALLRCVQHGRHAAWPHAGIRCRGGFHEGFPEGPTCKNGRIWLSCGFYKRFFPVFTAPLWYNTLPR